ncbi:hypothetical protein SAMN05216419_10059 [Nitrosomonas cryotolerans]|uniref:Cytochrome c domain-containing protein n=1 Tax=Nitrosomonas cryotolerans ATCC 49181 TaxID=1131553 RepID=A0A1N6G8Z6_9PROT|nr:hypothetical protein [Nitrosomonas cryotolerans]SFP51179.1 hypothetical protein SAMN05216419_10059 [Nitrosomonas cryotolerans]SIO03978.1 hypothetical protein SAMN02743940_0605 [Nitrosomonas cryotolerans ATCC 49181]
MKSTRLWLLTLLSLLALMLQACTNSSICGDKSGEILDEALCVGRTADTLQSATEDYFVDMDYGISKDPAEIVKRLTPFIPGVSEEDAANAIIRGRNNWIVWTAGNDALWDELSRASFGNLDFLKTLSNHPNLKFSRDNRWQYLGLVNEPCYTKGDKPREDRYGLYLDQRDSSCELDPFENAEKYPGIEIGARGKNIAVGSYYGYGTGIVGLRLFPNPDFDEKAEAEWDAEKYYNDPSYYNRKDLVKPYRVGMSCGFCHVGPNPTNPPKDPENPTWANLNSNPGAQYFWIDRIFMWNAEVSNFAFQLFHTSRPGALDTSFISSDYINNPRTMNAIYNLGARLEIATKLGKEILRDGSLNNKQFNQLDGIPENSALNQFYKEPETVFTPRVLKDGADSVGALGALNRVYINIGLFSQEWLQHFRPLVGGKKITPFEIEVARENSSYWNANEMQTPDLALFLLASARPDYLKDAAGGSVHLTDDVAVLDRGKQVFAETCARCHSSKLPDKAFDFFPDNGCINGNYLKCWSNYWDWTKSDEFKEKMQEIVKADNFLENNFLSTEIRIPVTHLETNACSPLATNAVKGNIWDNFSSASYKNLPSVGAMIVQNPYTGEASQYTLPAGGVGYTRPASLISVWSSAPFLLNNTLGEFKWSGSVDDRMASFNNSIEQLLWPEKRNGNFTVITKSGKTHPGEIDGTTVTSFVKIDSGYLPDFLQPLTGILSRWLPWIFSDDGIQIGPIPKGTPVSLISNIDMEQRDKVFKVLLKLKKDLKALPENATDEQARQVFANLLDPLIKVSKCPDYVVNKGHYFGTDYLGVEPGLNDEDKFALIEFLKTF